MTHAPCETQHLCPQAALSQRPTRDPYGSRKAWPPVCVCGGVFEGGNTTKATFSRIDLNYCPCGIFLVAFFNEKNIEKLERLANDVFSSIEVHSGRALPQCAPHSLPRVHLQVLTHPTRPDPFRADRVMETRRSPSVGSWSHGVQGLWAAALSHLGRCRYLHFLQLRAWLSTATSIPSDRQTERRAAGQSSI